MYVVLHVCLCVSVRASTCMRDREEGERERECVCVCVSVCVSVSVCIGRSLVKSDGMSVCLSVRIIGNVQCWKNRTQLF